MCYLSVIWFQWFAKKFSFEPDLNQRPKDSCMMPNYSPPLYQLSYRREIELAIFYSKIKLRRKCGREASPPDLSNGLECNSWIWNSHCNVNGGVAQMVERSLSMWEVPGSIPGASNWSFIMVPSEGYFYAIWLNFMVTASIVDPAPYSGASWIWIRIRNTDPDPKMQI